MISPDVKEDLTVDQVLNPSVRWCKSGHLIPENIKVYNVRGPVLKKSRHGNYCELCVSAAYKLARSRKESEKVTDCQGIGEVDVLTLRSQLLRAGFKGGIAEKEDTDQKESWEVFLEETK